MKKVRITIGALTRVEYSVVIEVPNDALLGEDRYQLGDDLYDQTDGSEFYSDDHYWERGETSFDTVDAPITHEIVDGKFVELSHETTDNFVCKNCGEPIQKIGSTYDNLHGKTVDDWEHCDGIEYRHHCEPLVLPITSPPKEEPPFRLEDELDGEARNPGHSC